MEQEETKVSRAKKIHKILTYDGWTAVQDDHNRDGYRLEKITKEEGHRAVCVLDLAIKMPTPLEGADEDLNSILIHINGIQPVPDASECGSGKCDDDKHRVNKSNFRKELRALLNTHNIEQFSSTPDYILADYLMDCLETFEGNTIARDIHLDC